MCVCVCVCSELKSDWGKDPDASLLAYVKSSGQGEWPEPDKLEPSMVDDAVPCDIYTKIAGIILCVLHRVWAYVSYVYRASWPVFSCDVPCAVRMPYAVLCGFVLLYICVVLCCALLCCALFVRIEIV